MTRALAWLYTGTRPLCTTGVWLAVAVAVPAAVRGDFALAAAFLPLAGVCAAGRSVLPAVWRRYGPPPDVADGGRQHVGDITPARAALGPVIDVATIEPEELKCSP